MATNTKPKFDLKRFKQAKWRPRTEDVPVPDLRDFFNGLPEGETPVWKVRGLTGKELALANEAANRNKDLVALVGKMAGGTSKEKAAAVAEAYGLDADTTPDLAKRIYMLEVGSEEPQIDLELAKIFCKAFPVEFYEITNKISRLTGEGHIPGKPQASGKEAT
jgi:hypothetical protein